MNIDNFTKEELWNLIVETVRMNVLFPTHKAYTREVILIEKKDIKYKELASKLNISQAEALVILSDLEIESKTGT